MRGFDRDLIRGGHYVQRSCEPHLKAEHMAAPTNAANVKKALANSEPSTHGTSRAGRATVAGAYRTLARRPPERFMGSRPNRTPVYSRRKSRRGIQCEQYWDLAS